MEMQEIHFKYTDVTQGYIIAKWGYSQWNKYKVFQKTSEKNKLVSPTVLNFSESQQQRMKVLHAEILQSRLLHWIS